MSTSADPDLLARLRRGVTTASAEETRAVAAALAAVLPPDCTLALHGELGVGKTTFVQGLARGLGLAAAVTSPTFAIYAVHRGPRWTLVHLDAYRLDRAEQLEELLLEDFLTPPYCLAVEWPEKVAGWLPADAWDLTLAITGDQQHSVVLR